MAPSRCVTPSRRHCLRQQQGKDTGTVRFEDGDVTVVAELPKKVEWDQVELGRLVERIKADGDDPREYVDITLKVSERKYAAWPAQISSSLQDRTHSQGRSAELQADRQSGGCVMALPIILADQRLAERRGIKAAIFGKSGIGKTSLLWTLDPQTTLFIDLEAGDLAIEGWTGDTIRPRTWEECRDFAVFIGGPNPALRDDQPYSPSHYAAVDAALWRSCLAREIPHDLRRLDHGCGAPVLPVVEGDSLKPSRKRPESPTCAAPTVCTAAR